jgi:hypothetical protein
VYTHTHTHTRARAHTHTHARTHTHTHREGKGSLPGEEEIGTENTLIRGGVVLTTVRAASQARRR